MKIYKDFISGDEVLSDSFPLTVVDDVVYEVKTKNIVQNDDDYVEANDPNEAGSGAVTVNNLVAAHNLEPTTLGKSDFMAYIKGYMAALKKHLEATNPGRVADFQKAAATFVKNKILGAFDEFEFYVGQSQNMEGIVLFKFYKGSDPEPYFYVFKDGLIEEKV